MWQVCNASDHPEASEREREVSGRVCEVKTARVFWPGEDNTKDKIEKLKIYGNICIVGIYQSLHDVTFLPREYYGWCAGGRE